MRRNLHQVDELFAKGADGMASQPSTHYYCTLYAKEYPPTATMQQEYRSESMQGELWMLMLRL
jgi:hypothetical protein